MKWLKSIVLLFLFQVNAVYSWNIIISNNDYPVSQDLESLLASVFKTECDFEKSVPIYLVTDGEMLKNKLNEPESPNNDLQILLLNEVYNIEGSILVQKKINLCGLRHLFPEVLANLTAVTNVDLVERSGDKIQFNSNLPAALSNDNRVKLIFRGDDNRYPAFYAKCDIIALNNLSIYHHEQSQAYALYGAGCTQSTPYNVCEDVCGSITHLKNIKIEDMSGTHPFLLRIEDTSFFRADRSEFNFKHNDTASLAETSVLYLYWTGEIRIINSKIVNYGNRGRAISWEGIVYTAYDTVIKNITIDSHYGNASITGFYLTGFPSPEDFQLIIYSSLPYLQNIIFKQGITTAFYFEDNEFHLRASGSDGNRFEGNGTHCYGVPDGILSFVDGTVCTNAVPNTESVNTTQEYIDSDEIPLM